MILENLFTSVSVKTPELHILYFTITLREWSEFFYKNVSGGESRSKIAGRAAALVGQGKGFANIKNRIIYLLCNNVNVIVT